MFVYLKEIENEANLRTLTKLEEYVLLAILNLKENAYLVTVQEFLEKNASNSLSFGTLHVLLRRLEQAELIKHYVGEATAKRGGKAIKFYELTKPGIEVLKEMEKVNSAMWINFSNLT